MDRTSLYGFMKRQRYGILSSVADDGGPQSALVGIVTTPELSIVFDTLRTSRKYANLVARPRCSLVVGWTNEQTVQIEGIAAEPVGNDLRIFQAAYFETWPDGVARLEWPAITYFVVRPKWLRYSDYGLSPPLIWETTA
jgi:pyridoxine/pyridoxamine 5'-phosphate oxidase